MDFEISAGQVKSLQKAGTEFFLLDVREPWEFETARIEGAKIFRWGMCRCGSDAHPKPDRRRESKIFWRVAKPAVRRPDLRWYLIPDEVFHAHCYSY